MSGRSLLQATCFFLRSTLRGRAFVLMVCAMVFLSFLSICTRLIVVRGNGDSFSPINVLKEKLTVRQAFMSGYLLSSRPGASEFVDDAAILFEETRGLSPSNSVLSLDGLLIVVLPFVAMFIGGGLSPQRDGPMQLLLSAPVSRFTLFLAHVATMLISLLTVVVLIWIGGSILLFAGVTAPWNLIRILTRMMALFFLYSIVFGGLGLALGILFSKRALGLMAGLVAIVLLVGVMPSVREMADRTYARNHREAYAQYEAGGEVPSDLAWYATEFVKHTPANALKTALWITKAFSPQARPGCLMCGGVQKPERGYSTSVEIIALAISAFASISFGCALFLRKEWGQA